MLMVLKGLTMASIMWVSKTDFNSNRYASTYKKKFEHEIIKGSEEKATERCSFDGRFLV
jgi:hypothetical protein